jgi:hypothetical protein
MLLIYFLATPDVIHQAQFALDVKAAVLPLYEKIFDVEFPLPKLDTLVVGTLQFRLYSHCSSPTRPMILMQVSRLILLFIVL